MATTDSKSVAAPPPAAASPFSDGIKEHVRIVQEYAILSARLFPSFSPKPRYLGDLLEQIDLIGVGSLSIVLLTGFFHRRGTGVADGGAVCALSVKPRSPAR